MKRREQLRKDREALWVERTADAKALRHERRGCERNVRTEWSGPSEQEARWQAADGPDVQGVLSHEEKHGVWKVHL